MLPETIERDFKQEVCESVRVAPEDRAEFDWTDPEDDPEGKYQVDCRINGSDVPLFVYALQRDNKVRDATISLLQFERWEMSFQSLAIFENQEETNRKVLARFSVGGVSIR